MISISEHVAWQRLDAETVVVNLRSGVSIGLSATASFVWERLPYESIESIAGALAERFNVDAEMTRADVSRFVDSLLARGLVVSG